MDTSQKIRLACERRQFKKAGELILDLLLADGQLAKPSAELLSIAAAAPGILKQKMNLPEDVDVTPDYSNRVAGIGERGVWEKDAAIQLMIFARLLGANSRTIPPPLENSILYWAYLEQAQKCKIVRDAYEYVSDQVNYLSLEEDKIHTQISRLQNTERPDTAAIAELTRKANDFSISIQELEHLGFDYDAYMDEHRLSISLHSAFLDELRLRTAKAGEDADLAQKAFAGEHTSDPPVSEPAHPLNPEDL